MVVIAPALPGALEWAFRPPRSTNAETFTNSAYALATSSLVSVGDLSCRFRTVAPSIEFTTVPKADAGGPAVVALRRSHLRSRRVAELLGINPTTLASRLRALELAVARVR